MQIASKKSCSRPTRSCRKGPAARRAERRKWNARTRKSNRPAGRWKKKPPTGADLEVQIRVPGQHVARAAHAAQQPAHPRPATGRERRRQSHAKQIEFAKNIHSSGNDLLNLINDILDLSKIESGTVTVEAEEISFPSLRDSVERTFRHVAESKNLPFQVEFDAEPAARASPPTPSGCSRSSRICFPTPSSSPPRATWTCKSQLAAEGLDAGPSGAEPRAQGRCLRHQRHRHRHSPRKTEIIFEAFQQADGGTSRKYGGTGWVWRSAANWPRCSAAKSG